MLGIGAEKVIEERAKASFLGNILSVIIVTITFIALRLCFISKQIVANGNWIGLILSITQDVHVWLRNRADNNTEWA